MLEVAQGFGGDLLDFMKKGGKLCSKSFFYLKILGLRETKDA
jgi:hypothetical protein